MGNVGLSDLNYVSCTVIDHMKPLLERSVLLKIGGSSLDSWKREVKTLDILKAWNALLP